MESNYVLHGIKNKGLNETATATAHSFSFSFVYPSFDPIDW